MCNINNFTKIGKATFLKISPHPIFNVGFPPQRHIPQIEEFDVTVVISSTNTAVLIVESMT